HTRCYRDWSSDVCSSDLIRDHLSRRVNTDGNGNFISAQGHAPFGEVWYQTPTGAWSGKSKFTSYERDGGTGESGNDYAVFRSYEIGRASCRDSVEAAGGD